VDDGLPQPRRNPLRRMLVGEPLPYTAIPTFSTTPVGDSLDIEGYTGSVPNDGPVRRVAQAQVLRTSTRTFLLGTDAYGRDVLSMLMIGSRVSLSVGFIAILIALLVGITLGALAAYHGGWVDNVILWLINVVWSIPTVLLVIAITFALGKGFWQIFVAVGLTMWVDIARVVRGEVLSIKEKEYVEATRALGFSTFRTIFRHILPNIVGAVVVVAASNFASAILLEAGLSFLGIGVQPPMPSWGMMVKDYYGYILLDSAYLALLPGAAIMLIVLAFMLLANGLRDALDIRR
ncbi:MAG: ABC transporter permease, partial [Bacteroidales bacterium]|nr:ABC transporter permease [Bacteroidales bacterium]